MKITQPTSLYIHLPWCIQKCPYCDFNSHTLEKPLTETAYIDCLLEDLKQDIQQFGTREISTIFIGGGTPSLFSATAINNLLDGISQQLHLPNDIEITLEANPGTVEQERFIGYRQAGINRLSLGIQSFQDHFLKRLGRIHDSDQAKRAFETARQAGFDNVNLDLMYALPKQTINEALYDLQQAIDFHPEHISWYQLTLEPNTVFYKYPPPLPEDDLVAAIDEAGHELLAKCGFQRYEVSAYSKLSQTCQHNINYWQFGDYLGIGAGAHGKLTSANGNITRTQKVRQPNDYLNPQKTFMAKQQVIQQQDIIFEFMLNALRLFQAISFDLFQQRTGLSKQVILPQLQIAKQKKLIDLNDQQFWLTKLGQTYLNDVSTLFLPD